MRLFKIIAPNGDIDWIITNTETSLTSDAVQDVNDICWQVEQLHRELKQLTGIAKCQCRKQRAQRNHISCCYQAWLAIKLNADTVAKLCMRLSMIYCMSFCEQRYVGSVTLLLHLFRSESPIGNKKGWQIFFLYFTVIVVITANSPTASPSWVTGRFCKSCQ